MCTASSSSSFLANQGPEAIVSINSPDLTFEPGPSSDPVLSSLNWSNHGFFSLFNDNNCRRQPILWNLGALLGPVDNNRRRDAVGYVDVSWRKIREESLTKA